MHLKVDGFVKHLRSLRLTESVTRQNPWFAKMYQQRRHCKLRGDFTSNYTSLKCSEHETYTAANIEPELYSIYMIKAMFAFIYGLKAHAATKCPRERYSDCQELFLRTNETATALRDAIKNVQVPAGDNEYDKNNTSTIFNANGDGSSSYVVYNLQSLTSDMIAPLYGPVYTFDENDTLSRVKNSSIKFYIQDMVVDTFQTNSCPLPDSVTASYRDSSDSHLFLHVTIPTAGVIIFILILMLIFSHKHWLSKRCRGAS